MRCPFCHSYGNRVIDSRVARDGAAIRRRRVCNACERRFTTYERVEEFVPMIIKKDNRREPYDRAKLVAGMRKAFEKRPVSIETIEAIADRIERALLEKGAQEVPSSFIGSAVMDALREIDQVAYVRFASVYRSFKDIDEFMHEVEELINRRKKSEPSGEAHPGNKKSDAVH